MSAIRVVLCDDEPEWLAQGKHTLEAYAQSNEITLDILAFTDGEAMLGACEQAPDVLFCDIELGSEKSGIDLAREVSQVWPSCQVVYVTNQLRYALDVYATKHMWFVLKEQFEERLPEIMERLQQQLEEGLCVLSIQTVQHELVSVPCTQIASFERKGRTTTITLEDGTTLVVADRLVDLLARLPSRLFARAHGSYVVGLGHVRQVRHNSLVLQSGAEIPLSRRYIRELRKRYLEWGEHHAL